MPLPPAPTKRAALLPPEAYDAPARSSHKGSRKSEAVQADSPLAEKPQALDFDPRGGGELHPEFREDTTGTLTPIGVYPTGGAGTGDGLGAQGAVVLSPKEDILFA